MRGLNLKPRAHLQAPTYSGRARRIMEDHIELDNYDFLEELKKLASAKL